MKTQIRSHCFLLIMNTYVYLNIKNALLAQGYNITNWLSDNEFANVISIILHQPFLTWGPRTRWGSMDRFQGVHELEWGKNLQLLSLASNGNLAFHKIMNVGNEVIYGLQTPEMFVNFNKSHYLYFMH